MKLRDFGWNGPSTHVLFNPRMPAQEVRDIDARLRKIQNLEAHLWIATSGSTAQVAGQLKWVALSKKALLASAQAVNQHLGASASDVWVHALPDFHVGGIGIFTRAHLSDARIVDGLISESDNDLRRWDAHHFLRICTKTGGTLTALVPTQVYDLIQAKLQAPASLRAIVVGGAALSESIYFEALNLGWPLLPSYGMTECCSQIATASLESLSANPRRFPEPELLSHVEVSQNDAGKIRVRSPSLLTGFAILSPGGDRWIDPKTDGWFQSEDMGEVLETAQGVFLKVRGRTSDFVKIGGESVDLNRLSGILSELRAKAATSLDLVVIDVSDERLGKVIHGVAAAEVGSADATMAQTIFDQFNARVLPFERVRKIHIVTEIPRSPLQKLLKPQLLAQLS